jgi:hypothetical protein
VAVAWCVSLIILISCYASARVKLRRGKSSRTRNGQCLNCDVAAGQADGPNADKSRALRSRRTMENRTMKTYTAAYNVPLTIEVKADNED